MKPALKWEVSHKEGLQNWAHEEIKIPDSENISTDLEHEE